MSRILSLTLIFALVVLKETQLGYAAKSSKNYIRGQQGLLRRSSLPRTSLSESSGDESKSESESSLLSGGSSADDRRLQRQDDNDVDTQVDDDDYPPCTYYYPTKKSKFNKYDDDWYNDCKEDEDDDDKDDENDFPTTKPTEVATIGFNESPTEDPGRSSWSQTKPPSPFYSSDSSLEIVTAPNKVKANTPRPTIPITPPAPTTTTVASKKPSLRPTIAPPPAQQIPPPTSWDSAIVVSEETSAGTVFKEEKQPSCLEAQSGQVVQTSINFTIYYEYELLTNREADLTNVVWPAVDEVFQRYIALNFIDCDIDVETDGASTTFASRLESVSSEPIDSVGTMYPDGWSSEIANNSSRTSSSCTNIVVDDMSLNEEEIFCDVVMGSVTIYLSDVSYMDSASDPSILFLEYRNDIFQSLRGEINAGGDGLSPFLDESLGIHSLYFITEPIDSNLVATLTIPQTIKGDSSGGSSTGVNSSETNQSPSSSFPAVAASLTALTLFFMVASGLFIHRRRKLLDDVDADLKQEAKTPQTPRMDDDDDADFFGFFGREESYGLDISDDESGDDSVLDDSSKDFSMSRKSFPRRAYNLNQSLDSEYDIPRVSSSDFATIYGLEDNTCDDSASFDYSHAGVSMQLLSPDGTVSTYDPTKCDPSPTASSCYLAPSVVDYPDDESSMKESITNESRSTPEDPAPSSSNSVIMKVANDILNDVQEEEEEPTTTTPPNTSSSSTLEYILSLGSSVVSSSPKSNTGGASSTPLKDSVIMKVANDILNDVQEEEEEPTTTTPPNTSSSSTLEYILSLGSSVVSSSPKSNTGGASSTPLKDSPTSIAATLGIERSPFASTASSPSISAHTKTPFKESPTSTVVTPGIKSKLDASSINYCSPTSITDRGILKTPPPRLSSDIDTAGSSESTGSSDHEEQLVEVSPSPSSRLVYLTNRRKALEDRFQNYRRSLSESINTMNDPAGGSWTASREFTRSVSLYKNSDQSSPAILGASPRSIGTSRVRTPSPGNKVLCGITPKTSNMTVDEQIISISPGDSTTTERVQEKQHFRPPRTPRVRNNYTSLNDIEDILDNDHGWRVSSKKDDDEKKVMDAFLSSRSSTKTEPVQFQADAVIL